MIRDEAYVVWWILGTAVAVVVGYGVWTFYRLVGTSSSGAIAEPSPPVTGHPG
jgi:hypothetical protein